jgi:xylulokinase
VVPNSGHTETYDGLYEIYREMYPATLDQVHRLALLQESSPD